MAKRPKTLSEVAALAESLDQWGLALTEFLDEVQHRRNRGLPLEPTLETAPKLLQGRISGGEIADAFAAALAEYLSETMARRPPPAWTSAGERYLPQPWFADDSPPLREYLTKAAPAAFRNHGVFIDAESLSRA